MIISDLDGSGLPLSTYGRYGVNRLSWRNHDLRYRLQPCLASDGIPRINHCPNQDGFSTADRSPEHVRQLMNDLEAVKGDQSGAEEAAAFAEAQKSGNAISTAPIIVMSLGELNWAFVQPRSAAEN